VTEGCVGWVRSRVVSEWTEAIREFIQYPKKMQEVILASRKYVESTYSIKRTALQMANNYFEIINQ